MSVMRVFILFIISFCCISSIFAQSPVPHKSQQILLVISEDWESLQGKLLLLEREGLEQDWKIADDIFTKPINIQLGKNGLAWGQGLYINSNSEGNIKKEGDGKSPAGIFELTHIFSYQYPSFELRMPFLLANSDLLCVDDMYSDYYNELVDTKDISQDKQDWNSYENMLRQDNLYEWGIVVAHNSPITGEGNGSCIFIHIQKGEGFPTAGCTSMPKEDLLKLIQVLDKDKFPILVQMPKEVLFQSSVFEQYIESEIKDFLK